MQQHELYMHRCIELAQLGGGYVAPNPMVGAVLVYENKIIGEGYHRQYGQAHAEVNCINNVREENRHLIEKSTIYVSLEPCAHFGKTPPCADLIIKHKIPMAVVGCRDPFAQVDGRGIEKLKNAGTLVITGVLEAECKEVNKRFFTFHAKKRPYIILKWAQSNNQKIAAADFSKVLISNAISNRLVHKWRSEEAAILVGTNTALHDNPALNVRNWSGPNPIRLVVDMNLRLPGSLQVYDKKQKTIVFNAFKNEQSENLGFYKIDEKLPLAMAISEACFQLNIQSVLVEGGAKLLQSFIDSNLWNEARIIENRQLIIDNGISAPILTNQQLAASEDTTGDVISFYKNRL